MQLRLIFVLSGLLTLSLFPPCDVHAQSESFSISTRSQLLAMEVPQTLAEHHVPSVSIAQIEDGRIVLTAAYGMQSEGVSATPATLYNIASLTKPITAEVNLRLASAGKLSLDEPMYRVWLDPDIAKDERAKLLTPRLALSHQTGFPNWRRQTGGVLAFKHAPGEVYGYSGEGFQYVAHFAANKTGTSFEELAQTLVLDPAGMKDTAFTDRPWFVGRIAIPADATGKALKPSIATKANAADLVYTTAGDYAKFVLSIMNHVGVSDALYRDRFHMQVATPDSDCATAESRAMHAEACAATVGFGLGWQVIQLNGQTFLTHGGSDDGVRTFVYMNLADHTGTVILTNGANGNDMVLPILDRLGVEPAFVQFLRATAH
jgi:CubicO group peptidase (beta-lactamase class C family)